MAAAAVASEMWGGPDRIRMSARSEATAPATLPTAEVALPAPAPHTSEPTLDPARRAEEAVVVEASVEFRIDVRGSFEPSVNAILSPTPSTGAVLVR